MSRTLLFLSADSFHACTWRQGELSPPQFFSNDADGRVAFGRFLEEHPQPTYLLVDVIEEDFRLETVPHLIGPARRELLERKFEQFYRSTPFRLAKFLHRLEGGRRDDEMLFSALTNPARITPWLDTLHAHRIPLVGIYSLPQISMPLVNDLPSGHVLLLSWEKSAGLRQTYFNNKRLHFSRLTPIGNASSFNDAVAIETPRTQQYLKSLSLPPPGEVLDIFIVCHADDKLALQERLSLDSEMHYTCLDIQSLAKRFKAQNEYADSDATPLFLHLLAIKPPATHYAHKEHTHFHQLRQLRRTMYFSAAAITCASLLWGAQAYWLGADHADDATTVELQTRQLQQQTQLIHGSFANMTVPAADMKTAVLLARQLDHYSPPPENFLHGLGAVLDQHAQIRLDKLAWQASGADAAPSPYPAQVITLDGALLGFNGDYRKALDYLERFRQELERQGYSASIQKMPLDISSKGSISGDTVQNDGNAAQFTLKIVWRQLP